MSTGQGTGRTRATRRDEWADVTVWWWLAAVVLTGVAFGIGSDPVTGVVIGGGMAVLVAVLHIGRRRSDAVRVLGGAGDERNQLLATRATSAAGGVLALVMTAWFLVSAVRGEPNSTLMVLLPLYLLLQALSSAYIARAS